MLEFKSVKVSNIVSKNFTLRKQEKKADVSFNTLVSSLEFLYDMWNFCFFFSNSVHGVEAICYLVN